MSKTKKPAAAPSPEAEPANPKPNIVAIDESTIYLHDVDSINRRGYRIFQQLSIVWAVLATDHDEEYWPDALVGARKIVAKMRDEAYWLKELPEEVGNLPCPCGDDDLAMSDGSPICVVTQNRDLSREGAQ